MKTVLLLRHANPSWDHPGLSDHQRPLSPRGKRAAPKVGEYMAQNDLAPDRVLCSTAKRAMESWVLAARELSVQPPMEPKEEIYHASIQDLLDLIQALPDHEESVLLVGHNPTFEELALALAGSGEEEALEKLNTKYPTGALTVLEFPGKEWAKLEMGQGHLRAFVRPRDLQP